MNILFFYHSAISDWNNGHAHFLRGVARELVTRGHEVTIYEPHNAWSLRNLLEERGPEAMEDFHRTFPTLRVERYRELELEAVLDKADVVIVHEWNPPELIQQIGRIREERRSFQLLFHDAHHRAVTAPEEMARFDLSGYDGVLAFGQVLREIYLENGWTDRAWVWHEAADIALFHPPAEPTSKEWDLVWIGNWGDGERSRELGEFLMEPVRDLALKAAIFGVRYSPEALAQLDLAGAAYRGWTPNHKAPELFARARVTVHVPRRPYAQHLRGIPTIRPFEALACGIPLISAPWEDSEHLFTPGRDYLVARDGAEMCAHLRAVLADPDLAAALTRHGLETILARHTCGHRADELLGIVRELRQPQGDLVPQTA